MTIGTTPNQLDLTLKYAQLHHFLRSRRSVRQFQNRPLPPEQIERILESALWAPSAHNRQPWRFAVLVDRADRLRLADSMGEAFRRDLLADGLTATSAEKLVVRSRNRILQAPLVVILCMSMSEMDVYPDLHRQDFERQMAAQSVALCGGTLLLAAHAEGLGGVWVCAPLFAQQIVRETLDLPADWEPQGMLLIGYPAQIPAPRPRKPIQEVVRHL